MCALEHQGPWQKMLITALFSAASKQKLQLSIKGKTDKCDRFKPGIFYSNENEQATSTCKNVGKSQRHN